MDKNEKIEMQLFLENILPPLANWGPPIMWIMFIKGVRSSLKRKLLPACLLYESEIHYELVDYYNQDVWPYLVLILWFSGVPEAFT